MTETCATRGQLDVYMSVTPHTTSDKLMDERREIIRRHGDKRQTRGTDEGQRRTEDGRTMDT